ncbi:MAG TPA: GAF domain-containing protein [Thermomicrobiales bacterium]|nr:GAF domain-containing protein [Thermomicrobiales bacterium]
MEGRDQETAHDPVGGDAGAGIAAWALLDGAPTGVAVTRGPRHLVVYANPGFRQLAGARAGPTGRPFAAAFPALAADGVVSRLYAAYAGRPNDGAPRPIRVAGDGAAGATFLDVTTRPTRDAAGRVDGLAVYAADVTDQVRAGRAAGRVARLQAVAAALAEALTPAEVAAAIVREGLTALGARAGGVVLLADSGSELEALHLVGYPPATAAAWRHYPLAGPSPAREAVETKTPVWVASPDELAARYPRAGDAAPAAGDRSWASLPLVVEGRVLGVLALGFAAEGAVPAEDRAYALALARLCAQSLERARLFAAAEEARRRAALLAEASRIFAATAPEPRALLAALARQVAEEIGDVCAISLLAADGRTLEPAVTDANDPELRRFVAELLTTWPVRLGEGLTGRVAQSGEPVLLPRLDPPALRAVVKPEHREPLARARPQSLLGVPLRAEGRVTGVLALARHDTDHPYTADDLALAQDLADRAALVLERARLAAAGRASRRSAERLAERLQLAQAAARIGAYEWDPETDVVAWTPEMEAIYGLPPGGAGFADWRRAVHSDDRPRVAAAIRAAVAAGGDLNVQFRIVRPDGVVRHLLSRGRMTRGDDGRPRMVGVNMDVTDREEALAAAEAAVRARDEFLAVAAHELRTPVTGLKGAAQLLRRRLERGDLDPAQSARLLGVLTGSADRLTALVDDLLDVSRIRTGRLPLAREPVDLAALARDAVAGAREQDAGAHRFALDLPAALAPVTGDPGRLAQVLDNLLENAAKYSPGGGTIAVAERDEGDGVAVTVRDEGIGVPAGSAEAIFRPFGRAPNAVRQQLPGLGLGLYICRDIVERHGGRIVAASAGEDRGATFTLWLPRDPDARREEGADG